MIFYLFTYIHIFIYIYINDASEEQGQLNAALFSLLSVVTGTMDINVDLGCNRVSDPDVSPDSSPGQNGTMTPGGCTVTQTCMAPEEAKPFDTVLRFLLL